MIINFDSFKDIISNDHKYKYSSDRVVTLQHESTQLEAVCEAEEKEIMKLEDLIEVIDEIVADSDSGRLELAKAAAAFREVKVSLINLILLRFQLYLCFRITTQQNMNPTIYQNLPYR